MRRSDKMRLDSFRRALVLLSISVSTYYMVWRLGTLNDESFLFSAVVYGAEVYGFIASLMFFYMVWRFPKRKAGLPSRNLKVDVFIPTLNEVPELLRKTVLGALSIDYPHRTYVLDDGDRPEVRELCEELGCGYINRKDNIHGKAGNLNNALGKTDGDFIVVFDADHVPEPDFLDKTLGYFGDEEVAFVQTPQDFYNVDSYQHRLIKGKLWNEQSLFFKVIMRGKDRSNSAFFCGSCAVIRRSALESVGGFATGTVTEDLHTSLRLHAKGWKSVYHPETLAYGVAPSRLSPFKNQRGRWGQGAMQVFLKENPLLTRGLTIPQRINYFASMTTYFDGFQKAVFYTAPVVVLLTGKLPISVGMKEFLPVFVPHILLSLWSFEEMSRGYGRLLFLEQYNMARFFTFMKSVLGVFKLRKPKFKVTNKENSLKTSMWELIPQSLVLAGSSVGIGYAMAQFPQLTNRGVYTANIVWASLNMSIASAYILWTTRKRYPRKEFRFPANFPALIEVNGTKGAVTLEDLHSKGAAIVTNLWINPEEEINLIIPFKDRELELKGKVVYSRRFGSAEFFRSGIEFGELSMSALKTIELFNFRFLLKRYMDDHDRPGPTPLETFMNLFGSWKTKPRRQRIETHAPGIIYAGKEVVPYTTEDISEEGMRILTYRELTGRNVYVGQSRERGIKRTRGSVVWVRELSFYGIKAYRYGIKLENKGEYEQKGSGASPNVQRRMA